MYTPDIWSLLNPGGQAGVKGNVWNLLNPGGNLQQFEPPTPPWSLTPWTDPPTNQATSTALTGPNAGRPVTGNMKQAPSAQPSAPSTPVPTQPVAVAQTPTPQLDPTAHKGALKDDMIAFLLSAGMNAIQGKNPIEGGMGALAQMGQQRMKDEETQYTRTMALKEEARKTAETTGKLGVDAASIDESKAQTAEAYTKIQEIKSNAGLTRDQKIAEIAKVKADTAEAGSRSKLYEAQAQDPDLKTSKADRTALAEKPKDIADFAAKLSAPDAFGRPTMDPGAAAQKAIELWPMFEAASGVTAKGAVAPPAPTTTPSALPAGIPPGSTKIGTAQGKAVWQAPDGKRYRETGP